MLHRRKSFVAVCALLAIALGRPSLAGPPTGRCCFEPPCPADVDDDGDVDVDDLVTLLLGWAPGGCGDACAADIDRDQDVDVDDLVCLLLQWAPGGCPAGTQCDVTTLRDCEALGGEWAEGQDCDSAPCGDPTGACCADGSCSQLTEDACTAAGGTYQGDRTTCDPDPCIPPATGACCAEDDTCSQLTEKECALAGGDYQGDRIACDPDPCLPPATGACCLAGECSITTEADCADQGGAYVGDDSTCEGDPCAAGACCLPGGGCDSRTEESCLDAVGNYQGDGTSCGAVACDDVLNDFCEDAIVLLPGESITASTLQGVNDLEPGCGESTPSFSRWFLVTGTGNTMTASTCSSATGFDTSIEVLCECISGACVSQNDDDANCTVPPFGLFKSTATWCSLEGETYYLKVGGSTFSQRGTFELSIDDAGKPCDDAICPPTGACCLDDLTCVELTELACAQREGSYLGNDTTCKDDGSCPGACCLPGGGCDIMTDAECAGVGGVYQGDGVTCGSAACEVENDFCATALLLAPGESIAGSNAQGVNDLTPGCGVSTPSFARWFIVMGTGEPITVTTCSTFTDLDTAIEVLTECVSDTCIAENDDDPGCTEPPLAPFKSTATWLSIEGQPYFIKVGGSTFSQRGNFQLTVIES